MADDVFLAEVFGSDDNVAHLYKVGEGFLHLAKLTDAEAQEAADRHDAGSKAGPVDGTCTSENAPAETIDHADNRIQAVKQAPFFWDNPAAETDGRDIETKLYEERNHVTE